jgi:anti-anti-sigma regulatory factor
MEMNQKGFMEKTHSGPEKPVRTTLIELGGDLSIVRAGELKQIISEALNEGEHVVLECSECTDMDLSFLQLLCSAHRTVLKSNSFLKLGNTLEEYLLKKVGEAGYFRDKGCALDKNNDCFWLRR